ncbi:MAG TPA: YdcF family protein [Candidatus Acidoferrum sp.]|nr:YdcF family protein [Candidatus Acidoferrum sp.]
MKPRTHRIALALAACGLMALLLVLAARGLGPWLVVNEPLARSDAIFVADGGPPQRELEGAALFLEGWAPRVAVTLPRDPVTEEARRLSGEPPPQERGALILRQREVPETAIVRLERIVENTREELQADFDYARTQGFRRVIIVSSPYHTRRIRLIWRSRFEDEIPAIIRVTRYDPVDPARWWRSRRSLEEISHEVFGIANFLLGSPIPTFDRGR